MQRSRKAILESRTLEAFISYDPCGEIALGGNMILGAGSVSSAGAWTFGSVTYRLEPRVDLKTLLDILSGTKTAWYLVSDHPLERSLAEYTCI